MSTVTPLAYTRQQAAEACSVGVDAITEAIVSGKLRAKRQGVNGGGKYLIRVVDLEAWLEGLADA